MNIVSVVKRAVDFSKMSSKNNINFRDVNNFININNVSVKKFNITFGNANCSRLI